MFLDSRNIESLTWQAFERAVYRLLLHRGFTSLRIVGQSGDGGADVLATYRERRWLVQVKRWKRRVGSDVVSRTVEALRSYRAAVPVVASREGFTDDAVEYQRVAQTEGIPLQLWDGPELIKRAAALAVEYPVDPQDRQLRPCQEEAVGVFLRRLDEGRPNRALVVLATGLGKTFVAAEGFRRASLLEPRRILCLAHTNPLVYQLERAFWPFLLPTQDTVVWNGLEKPTQKQLETAVGVFACIDSVHEYVVRGGALPGFDVVLVDECHHAGAQTYRHVLNELAAGQVGGPFLLGLTATPWRPDEVDISTLFGEPAISVDMITGLRKGYLANVDYRLYTDNIDWNSLRDLSGKSFSPRQINRTLFIEEWDDSVVYELQRAWQGVKNPRAIVFCGTIEHAYRMADRINALGFCAAGVIASQGRDGRAATPIEKNRVLCDFADGILQTVCAVDIFNEGVDVPDVNIVVFQRVTHSRRIFVQQLGRGLRLANDKEKVLVLDFVSDIRRFAAGLELKDQLGEGQTIRLPHSVTFRRVGDEDPATESFLREWLKDVAAVEDAGDDSAILAYPPPLDSGR